MNKERRLQSNFHKRNYCTEHNEFCRVAIRQLDLSYSYSGSYDIITAVTLPPIGHMWPLLLTWISNYIHYNVWDEITYPFLNFNGATVEV